MPCFTTFLYVGTYERNKTDPYIERNRSVRAGNQHLFKFDKLDEKSMHRNNCSNRPYYARKKLLSICISSRIICIRNYIPILDS